MISGSLEIVPVLIDRVIDRQARANQGKRVRVVRRGE